MIWRTKWLYFFRLVNQNWLKLACLHLNGRTCSLIFQQMWRFTKGGGCFGCEEEGRQDIAKKLFVDLGHDIEEWDTIQRSELYNIVTISSLVFFHLGLLTSSNSSGLLGRSWYSPSWAVGDNLSCTISAVNQELLPLNTFLGCQQHMKATSSCCASALSHTTQVLVLARC